MIICQSTLLLLIVCCVTQRVRSVILMVNLAMHFIDLKAYPTDKYKTKLPSNKLIIRSM
jgi:hypothetical protein